MRKQKKNLPSSTIDGEEQLSQDSLLENDEENQPG